MAQKIRITLILLLCLAAAALAASKADIKKFPPVSGEIYGQAAPGVTSILVNGRPVTFDAHQNFRAFVNLKAGEKYLTLRINYEEFRMIKKYLIIRRPQVKTFKVYVPKEKIEKAIKEVKPAKKVLPRKKRKAPAKKIAVKKLPVKKAVVKTAPAATKVCEYLYVWEFSEGKLLLVKETKGEYSAEILVPVSKQWLELKGISEDELREIIERPVSVSKPLKGLPAGRQGKQ